MQPQTGKPVLDVARHDQPKAVRHRPDDPALVQILQLIKLSFFYMDSRIDPPSSMHGLSLQAVADQCVGDGEVWSIGQPADACIFLTRKADALYLGKMAVAQSQRGSGLARTLIEIAIGRASAMNLPYLELNARVELVENQLAFARLGFVEVARGSHPGFDRPTFVVMRRPVGSRP